MTDDELKRTPIASAPLSVLLLSGEPGAEIDSVTAGWVELLHDMNRTFELIVVGAAVEPAPAAEPDLISHLGNDALPCDPPERPTPVQPLTQRFHEVRFVAADGQGLGQLLRAGLAEATQPLVVCTRADRQYQAADLKKQLEVIDGVDLVTGIRTGRPIPWWLRIVDFCFGWFCAILFGLPVEPRVSWLGWRSFARRMPAYWFFGVSVQDPECLFFLVRREMLRRMVIQADGSFAPVEFLAKANFFNALMAEVPVAFNADQLRFAPESPTFVQQASLVFRQPDFGPTFLPQPPTLLDPALNRSCGF